MAATGHSATTIVHDAAQENVDLTYNNGTEVDCEYAESMETKTVRNDAEQYNKRVTAYTYQDRHFAESVKCFLANSRFEARRGWTAEIVRRKLRERNIFFSNYINTGNPDDLPESFSTCEPLLFSNIACNGFGGLLFISNNFGNILKQ